jgi:predicted dinucleotide-binding enzyme
MRVAVIGTGKIGSTVGAALNRGGQDVVYGSRRPGDANLDGGTVTDVASALDGADAVLLAIPAQAVEAFLDEHATALDGVLVVDATNNIGAPVANAAAQISAAAPGARYARAFNSLGFESFADPVFDGERADLFFASDEADRGRLEELISAVGLRPAYLGADAQDTVDLALPLWLALVRQRGHRGVALRVVEKKN